MGQWVIAYCTKPLGDRFFDLLEHALDAADFGSMAESQGLDEDDGHAAEEPRYERFPDAPNVVHVHYQHHELGEQWMRCEYHTDGDFIRDTITSQLDQEPPAPARELLPRIVATVAFELTVDDWSSMGLPIAYYLAMELAKPDHGDGLVEVEGKWWDPKTYDSLS
jgi:hypothetical protein